jgi:hypothetical protein
MISDLTKKGYAVIPDVLTREECAVFCGQMWSWLEDFGTGVDRAKPKTWKSNAMPSNLHGIFQV